MNMKKKVLAVILIFSFLFCGCAEINKFLCSPTAAQIQAANVMEALAQAAIVAASTFTGNPIIAGLSQYAIPTAQKIQQGYCVTAEQWTQATNAIAVANTNPVVAKAISAAGSARAVEDPIKYLQTVAWK